MTDEPDDEPETPPARPLSDFDGQPAYLLTEDGVEPLGTLYAPHEPEDGDSI